MEELNKFLDLMKHHLMFAVREEIQILKNTIGELVERVNELEVENRILRCNSTPETLAAIVKNTAAARTTVVNSSMSSSSSSSSSPSPSSSTPSPPPPPLPQPLAENVTNFENIPINTNTNGNNNNFK